MRMRPFHSVEYGTVFQSVELVLIKSGCRLPDCAAQPGSV
jgi:hypothetical protein